MRLRLVAAAVVAVSAVSACGTPVGGMPVPAAGFGPVPMSVTATPVSIEQPRRVAGVDPCTVLTGEDLAAVGGVSGPPVKRDATFPESCVFPLGGGAADDLALVAFHRPFEQVRQDQPRGREETTSGHSTWVYCDVTDGYRTCVAAIAVRADRTLVVALDRRDTSEESVLGALQPMAEKALGRLRPD